MSREIRYDPEARSRVPKYIDHGHLLRKVPAYAVALLYFIPHVLFYGAGRLDEAIEPWISRLHVWSHPCLYAKRGESNDEYRKRVGP